MGASFLSNTSHGGVLQYTKVALCRNCVFVRAIFVENKHVIREIDLDWKVEDQ